jgi:hypothetical protein
VFCVRYASSNCILVFSVRGLNNLCNDIIELCAGFIAYISLSQPWDLYISANWTTGKTKKKNSTVTMWSPFEVFHCWWLFSVSKLFWYGNMWSLCTCLVILERVTSVQEKHLGGHANGCHPIINYFTLHDNILSLAIYMQLYVMSFYKCVKTLHELFLQVFEL